MWLTSGLSSGFARGVLLGTVVVLSTLFVAHFLTDRSESVLSLPALPVHAVASASNSSFLVATGAINEENEGLYCLDPITGELSCWILNRNSAKFSAVYRYKNVMEDVGDRNDKNPEFLLLTGEYSYKGVVRGTLRPVTSVVYVVNSTNGKFAAYTVLWNDNLWQVEQHIGELQLLDTGVARKLKIRE
jgi:hypothetical protein